MRSQVTTKRGDQGRTVTISGDEYSKSHPLLECCGDLDALRAETALCRLEVVKSGRDDAEELVLLVAADRGPGQFDGQLHMRIEHRPLWFQLHSLVHATQFRELRIRGVGIEQQGRGPGEIRGGDGSDSGWDGHGGLGESRPRMP